MKNKTLIVITGPTGIGKTDLSLALAEKFEAEIINCDSRQFYREMNIGTAKPSAEELNKIPHHFINNLGIEDEYSVGKYADEAENFLLDYFNRKDKAILCGGSGLYIHAVLNGFDEFPKVKNEVKEATNSDFEKKGLIFLQKELERTDPSYYAQVDLSNPQRVIRAINVIRQSKQPYSSFLTNSKKRKAYKVVEVLLERPREELYKRIENRVDLMMAAGLEEEVRSLYPHRKLNALRTVGYAELFSYFEGIFTKEMAIQKIKQHTRNYAKRQITWFKKLDSPIKIHPDHCKELDQLIMKRLH